MSRETLMLHMMKSFMEGSPMKKLEQPETPTGIDEQHAEFARVLDLMTNTYLKKNAAYGSNAINSTGSYGIVVRMSDKVQRLITLSGKTLHDGNAHEYTESYEDTLLDLAVYAVIGIIYERGKWGK